MPKNIDLTDNLEKYVIDHSENLTDIQKASGVPFQACIHAS